MHRHSRGLCVGLTIVVGMLWFAAGCSSKPKTTADAKPVSGTDEQIFLGDTIEKNYDPNVIMKRGEAFFDKEEFAEAIVEYQHFLELHRAHQLAVYAQLQRIADCHDWLAQTHLFVGQFYYRRASYLAAAHRFDQIMKDYPDKKVAPEALYYLALTYQELGADDWAMEKLQLLAEKYPNSENAGDGRRLLAKLEKKSPPAPTVVAKTDTPAPQNQPSTTLLAASVPSSSFTPSATPSIPNLKNSPALSLGQPFVSCRLGAWC